MTLNLWRLGQRETEISSLERKYKSPKAGLKRGSFIDLINVKQFTGNYRQQPHTDILKLKGNEKAPVLSQHKNNFTGEFF